MSFNPADLTPEEIAFEMGYQAYLFDYTEGSNPYPERSEEHEAWLDGWNTAAESLSDDIGDRS